MVLNIKELPDFDISSNNCHAGYARLKFKDPECEQKILKGWKSLDLAKLPRSLLNMGKSFGDGIISSSDIRVTHRQTGPSNSSFFTNIGDMPCDVSLDAVQAIPGPNSWPIEAGEWKSRHRPAGWPSPSQVKEITSLGYLLVPVAHSSSECSEVEWRMSFSEAENSLLQSLSPCQKNCYIIVKLLLKPALSGWKLLSTYHIKSIFLLMCEEYPCEVWRIDNLGQMACLLMDKIILALSKEIFRVTLYLLII